MESTEKRHIGIAKEKVHGCRRRNISQDTHLPLIFDRITTLPTESRKSLSNKAVSDHLERLLDTEKTTMPS